MSYFGSLPEGKNARQMTGALSLRMEKDGSSKPASTEIQSQKLIPREAPLGKQFAPTEIDKILAYSG